MPAWKSIPPRIFYLLCQAGWLLLACRAVSLPAAYGSDSLEVGHFQQQIEPLLREHCYECHSEEMTEGGVAFDGFESPDALVADPQLWYRVLRMVRSQLMPPADMTPLAPEDRDRLIAWIKQDVFHGDPQHPDPGQVTLRRLNRTEYRNTIRDLLGVDFDTLAAFPQDDLGYGFNTIGSVQTMSPLLLEKYLAAARQIVTQVLPQEGQSPPPAAKRYFPADVPDEPRVRRALARASLERFATHAYRRPVDKPTLDKLTKLAVRVSSKPGASFEQGLTEAMAAVLSSPQFLYRVERHLKIEQGEVYPRVDDYSLASRLSYFLWSTMPDRELMRLAAEGTLQENLLPQLERMLKHRRSQEFIRNFVGQWLQAQEVQTVVVDGPEVMRRDLAPPPEAAVLQQRLGELGEKPADQRTPDEQEEMSRLESQVEQLAQDFEQYQLQWDLRQAMQRETEMVFERILREDRSLLELLDSDTTYLNEPLARHYGIEGVQGEEMRFVQLPAGSVRGGILTQATMLMVTSNPNRTSPVKRGRYLLENILGSPAPPPPANVPPLEAAQKDGQAVLTVAEALAVHREDPLCSSCHDRMDPPGLALEHFNALGRWRETDQGQPINASGSLITGEAFSDVQELKKLLVTNHTEEFYRCAAEKLLMYALGRGLDYHDTETVDAIVTQLLETGGRPSALLQGVVQSAAFQRCRASE